MDFSNLKKIFYIVAIISMLLSIKNRVFGFSFNYDNEDYSFIMPDWVEENDIHYYIAINQSQSNPSSYTINILFYTENQLDLTTSGNNYVFDSSSSSGWLASMARNFNSFTEAINYYNNTLLPGITYQSYQTYKSRFSYLSNYALDSTNSYDLLCAFCDTNVYIDNNLKLESNITPPFSYPSFDNVTEIENGNPDGVYISVGDFSNNDNLYFHLLQINTGLANSDQSIYYYSDKTFLLNKDSEYYKTWADPNIEGFYYYIPRYKLSLSQNTSYLYVLNNSKNQIQNSQGIYEKDVSNGIYDVLQSDTAGVISATEEQSDRLHNIEVQQQEALKEQKNFQDTLTDTNIQNTTENEVDTSLNYSADNQQLNNVFTGLFSRLSTWLSQFLDYDITQDTTLNIPIPHSEQTITLHSNILYNQLHNTALYPIIYTFYMFIFMTNLVLFYTKVYARLVTGGYLNTLKNPITDSGIDKTIL